MTTPIYTPTEARTRETFLALMWSLSYPSRTYALPETDLTDLALIGEALLDLDTSYFTTDARLADQFVRLGARSTSAADADYHFYSTLNDAALATMKQAKNGSMLRPDESATIIVRCNIGTGDSFKWTGPGIMTQETVQLGGIPDTFWELHTRALRYPQGWDVYFVDGGRVIGLPRTTVVEG